VFYDLRIFLLFYGILVLNFSLVFSIFGTGNFNIKSDFSTENKEEFSGEYFGREYYVVGLFWGNIFQTMRASMGDYEFEGANKLDDILNRVYWAFWTILVTIMCIVFLNFIICEASASYEKVKTNLEAEVAKERANLVCEADSMIFASFKNEANRC